MQVFPVTFSRAVASVAAFALCVGVAGAQTVSVTVNGQATALNPAPVMRAGRVFVPLRGVFERLGASVVYANGSINAQGNGRSIGLHIGSTQATINGQSQAVDVAPFIIGASTYVPLRFVAQALGAQVNWDNANRVVAIATASAPAAPPPQAAAPAPPAAPDKSPLDLGNLEPARGSSVQSSRPTIEAGFVNASADPNSVHVSLDGLDVTAETTRSPNGIVYSPPSDLQSQEHTVRVSGKDTNGRPFERGWRFASGTARLTNFIRGLTPADGTSVAPTFTVTGHTLPGASIQLDAGAQTVVGGFIAFGGDHERVVATADPNGNFAQQLNLNVRGGQSLTLVVTSTDPNTKGSVRVTRHYTVQ